MKKLSTALLLSVCMLILPAVAADPYAAERRETADALAAFGRKYNGQIVTVKLKTGADHTGTVQISHRTGKVELVVNGGGTLPLSAAPTVLEAKARRTLPQGVDPQIRIRERKREQVALLAFGAKYHEKKLTLQLKAGAQYTGTVVYDSTTKKVTFKTDDAGAFTLEEMPRIIPATEDDTQELGTQTN